MTTRVNKYLKSLRQQPQRQDSLAEQIEDLHWVANRLGMYDAADWLFTKSKLLMGRAYTTQDSPGSNPGPVAPQAIPGTEHGLGVCFPQEHIHKHGDRTYRHSHAWGELSHNHMLRAICGRPECEGSETHNIHPGGRD